MSTSTYLCECDERGCVHVRDWACCSRRDNLLRYSVGGIIQRLCPGCAIHASRKCEAAGTVFRPLWDPPSDRRRRRWTCGDWACASVLTFAVLWLLIEVVPAFFDGRVAAVTR